MQTELFLPGMAPVVKVKKPRPLSDVATLVEVWKDIEGIRDRTKIDVAQWNKNFFARHARECKTLLTYLGSVEAVEMCMTDVVGFMRKRGCPYSISTVVKWMDRWKFTRQRGREFK